MIWDFLDSAQNKFGLLPAGWLAEEILGWYVSFVSSQNVKSGEFKLHSKRQIQGENFSK